jgi:hypothetical protein
VYALLESLELDVNKRGNVYRKKEENGRMKKRKTDEENETEADETRKICVRYVDSG